jgi:hypothetical protein
MGLAEYTFNALWQITLGIVHGNDDAEFHSDSLILETYFELALFRNLGSIIATARPKEIMMQ